MNNTMEFDVLRFKYSILPPVFFLLALWITKIVELSSGSSFHEFGVYPRQIYGLPGILLAIFIHSDFNHLISNSVSFFILSSGLIYFYRDLSYKVILFIWLTSGIMLWFGARESYHIGASGLIYGIASFLFFSGIIRRDIRLMAISMLVVFLYGSLIWGVLPIYPKISWEYHLFGSICGFITAVLFRNQGPDKHVWSWENEDEDVDDSPVFEINDDINKE